MTLQDRTDVDSTQRNQTLNGSNQGISHNIAVRDGAWHMGGWRVGR